MDSPPIKPPRGVKTTKETSGLLMSVIRTLSATETNEQRDREKAKLDNEFKLCDKRLDDLVQKHGDDLTQVMTIFGALSQQVTDSQEKIQRIKKNLQACKTLLHCKRDDLKKLWIEGLEYKYMLQLLEEIEKMHEIPVKVQTHLAKKEFLHATKLLVEAATLGKDSLEGIEGIKELKTEIEQKKEELRLILLNELKQQIYTKTSQHVISLSRQSSQKEGGLNSQFRRSNEFRMSSRRNIPRRIFQEASVKFEGKFDDFEVEEDLFVLSQESDPSHFVAILVKCLALLDRIPYAIDVLKTDMKSELLNIAQRTTIFINDFKHYREESDQNKPSLLVEFIQTLFEQFKQVAHAHALLLKCFQRAIVAHKIDAKVFDINMYWAQVQFVIQNLLQDYLDIQNLTVDVQPNDHFTNVLDNLSSYFSRRKQQPKKSSLFKFDDSASALTMTSTLKETDTKQDKILVCAPDINNILHIFIPLICFVEDIEESMGLPHGSKCTLHQFLSGYVTNTFLKRKHTETKTDIEDATHAKDSWKATILLDVTVDYKPLLVSVVTVEKTITQWQIILKALPMYGEHIVKYACDALKEFRDICHAAYRGIVQPHTEDRRICSAAWLKDDDISRFLKSLPNWVNLKAQQETHARIERRRTVRRELTVEEESPEDIRQRNRREAEILAGNLGEGGVSAGEILSDMSLLKQLAQLQESMEWFSVRMLQFASEFRHEPTLSPSGNNGLHIEAVPSAILQQLTSIAQDFDELANTCLLLLHLEVRVQCFHYLLAVDDYNKQTHEPDPKVLELSKVLACVDEAMTSSLHPRKCKYIFEGLGHLIAKILITSTQNMQLIDESGIQRMCRNVFALQQTLTNITMTREVALDHARHYFELFFLTPEEILNGIVEKGPEFSELEYMNAFQLLNRSNSGTTSTINVHLERLSDILGEVGVTV